MKSKGLLGFMGHSLSLRFAARLVAYILIIALLGNSAHLAYAAQQTNQKNTSALQAKQGTLTTLHQVTLALGGIHQSLKKAQSAGLDTSTTDASLKDIDSLIKKGQYQTALTQLNGIAANLGKTLAQKAASDLATQQATAAAEALKGNLTGVVHGAGSILNSATVSLSQNGVISATTQTNDTGSYYFHITAGTYTLTITNPGFVTQTTTVTIVAGQNTSTDVTVNSAPISTPPPVHSSTPKPTPPPASSSTAHSSYYTTTLSTSRGNFSAYVMQFELGAGKIKVMTDTGNTSDCSNACTVYSVQHYVQQDGGIAGINGTYFCPQDYSSCAGQTNSFFWKVINSNTGTMINKNNGLGEGDSFLAFDSVGNPRFFSTWNDYMGSGFTAYAGINHKPLLVRNGANVLDESQLDNKQETSKIERGALALKGSTLYVVDITNATIPDLAAAIQSMGVDNAINIDSGGSAGMYYNGSYRLGPGRGVPNALVFIEQ